MSPVCTLDSCPSCTSQVTVDRSVFIGEVRCFDCGEMLWFIQTSLWIDSEFFINTGPVRFFTVRKARDARDRVIALVADHFGVDRSYIWNVPSSLKDVSDDGHSGIELAFDLEEEVDLRLRR